MTTPVRWLVFAGSCLAIQFNARCNAEHVGEREERGILEGDWWKWASSAACNKMHTFQNVAWWCSGERANDMEKGTRGWYTGRGVSMYLMVNSGRQWERTMVVAWHSAISQRANNTYAFSRAPLPAEHAVQWVQELMIELAQLKMKVESIYQIIPRDHANF